MISGLEQSPITLTSMIAHGHGDERYCPIFKWVVAQWSQFYNWVHIVPFSHFGNIFSFKVKTIVGGTPTKLILCMSFTREIMLCTQNMHVKANCWC
jgi:hypothetical protein